MSDETIRWYMGQITEHVVLTEQEEQYLTSSVRVLMEREDTYDQLQEHLQTRCILQRQGLLVILGN